MRDILMELANWSDTSIDTPTPGPNHEQQWGRATTGYRTEPSSQTSSPRGPGGGQNVMQPRSDVEPEFLAGPADPATMATRRVSQPPMSSSRYTGESASVPEDVNLPWWFVSRENGMQGLEGAVSHPTMASGSTSVNQNINGVDYLPEMFGGMPPPQNMFGRVPLGPNITQGMQGNRFQPTNFRSPSSGSVNIGYGGGLGNTTNSSSNMPPPATGTTPTPNVANEFWSMQDPNALEMSGVLADIWSMAPSTFE
jgi:hypothetical protein